LAEHPLHPLVQKHIAEITKPDMILLVMFFIPKVRQEYNFHLFFPHEKQFKQKKKKSNSVNSCELSDGF
jgi:hypothetical protein